MANLLLVHHDYEVFRGHALNVATKSGAQFHLCFHSSNNIFSLKEVCLGLLLGSIRFVSFISNIFLTISIRCLGDCAVSWDGRVQHLEHLFWIYGARRPNPERLEVFVFFQPIVVGLAGGAFNAIPL